MFKNRFGFSMVEVMVAAALLGALSYGVMVVSDNIKSVETNMLNMMEANEIHNMVRFRMASFTACNANFEQLKTDDDDDEDDIPLVGSFDKIVDVDANPLFEVGEKYGRMTIDDLHFYPQDGYFSEDEFFGAKGFVDLVINLTGTGQKKKSYIKKIPIAVVASKEKGSDPKFEYCDSAFNEVVDQISRDVVSKVCKSFEVEYNPILNKCDMEQLKKKLKD